MGLAKEFSGFSIWTEVIQDGFLDLLDEGKIEAISCAGTAFTPDGMQRLLDNLDDYAKKMVIRQGAVSNHPELIRRLGVVCMNTPLEFDIYANVNSSVATGTAIVNGLGGSGDFMRNAYLSIMHTPSTRPSKTDPNGISCVVPFASHIDHTEHEMHVLVTEQGLADLRGLVPRERAKVIIENCAHPDYRPQLQEYFDRASRECLAKGRGYIPHMLPKAFKMYENFEKHGTMKLDSWD
jgi:acetyl-CoA hydrolase